MEGGRGVGFPCALALALFITGSAGAQEGATGREVGRGRIPRGASSPVAVDEIVVEGQRVDHPLEVDVLSAETLEVGAIRDLENLGSTVAGLKLDAANGSNTDARIFIRGVGQSDPRGFVDPGVGVYVDGVYYPGATGSLFSLFDVERVEVARGPQGTDSGKNLIGGAISVTTRKPGPAREGRAQLRVGNLGLYETRLSFNVPLRDERVYARLSTATATRDGYLRNRVDGSRAGDDKLLAGRLALRMLPADWAEWSLVYARSRESERGRVGQCRRLSDLALPAAVAENTSRFREACDESRAASDLDVFTSEVPKNALDIQSVTSTWSLDLGRYDLRLTSSWREVASRGRGGDFDGTRVRFISTQGGARSRAATTHELSLAVNPRPEVRWVTGLYFLREKERSRERLDFLRSLLIDPAQAVVDVGIPFSTGDPFAPADPSGLPASLESGIFQLFLDTLARLNGFGDFGAAPLETQRALVASTSTLSEQLRATNSVIHSKRATHSYAWYGAVAYDWNDSLRLTAGLRYTHERKYRRGHRLRRFPSERLPTPFDDLPRLDEQDLIGRGLSDRFSRWTGRLAVELQLSDGLRAYGSYSTGFRSGGFNAEIVQPGGDGDPFASEKLQSVEIGFEGQWLDRRLEIGLRGFVYRYDDMQLFVRRFRIGGSSGLIVENAARASVRGVELDWRMLLEDLRIPGVIVLAGGASLTDAQYEDFRTDVVEEVPPGLCPSLRISECPIQPGAGGGASPFLLVGTLLSLPGARTQADVDVSDRDLPHTPAISFHISATHQVNVGSLGSLTTHLAWYHQGETFQDVESSDEARQAKFGVLSARIALGLGDGRTQIAIFGRNLLDRRYTSGAINSRPTSGKGVVFFSPPRLWGIEISREF